MSKIVKILTTLVIISFLSACGTTTGLKSPQGGKYKKRSAPLANYDQVVVMTFEDNAASSPMRAGDKFANLIASKIAATRAYAKVSRSALPGRSIVISGKITEFDEGNTALRLMIGFGAGSSKFDAQVKFTDSTTGQPIGSIQVDQHSWLLGGIVAATQDTGSHMNAAASKIAKELRKAKRR